MAWGGGGYSSKRYESLSLSLPTILFRCHHSFTDTLLLTLFVSMWSPLYPSLSLSLLLILLTIENARVLNRRDRIRSRPKLTERFVQLDRTSKLTTPWNLLSRSERALRADRNFSAVSLCPDRVRCVFLSLSLSFALYLILFLAARIAWVPSIAVPFRGCSLVRWRASNDELRSLPTQRSGSLARSPSCLARSLPRSRLLSRSPARPSPRLARTHAALPAAALVPSRSLPGGMREAEGIGDSRLAVAPNRAREREIGRYTACASAKNVYTYGCYLRGGKSTPCERRLPRREGRSE